jgi:hypothetical protein
MQPEEQLCRCVEKGPTVNENHCAACGGIKWVQVSRAPLPDSSVDADKPAAGTPQTSNVPVEETPGEIKVPVLELPNRAELRSIMKTGKGLNGFPVHPDSVKNLRKATIADLLAFGQEVNKANAALNHKLDGVIDNMDLALKEVNWNFATFLSFLGSVGILKEDSLPAFEKFKAAAEEEMVKAGEFLLKQQEEKARAAAAETPKPKLEIVK